MQLLPIKCFLFVLAGLVFFTLAGRGAGRFLRLRLNICEEVCIGFLAFFGAAEAFGWFFTAYRLPTLLFSAVILLIAGALIYAGRRSPEEISHSRQNRGRTTWRELFPFPLLPVIAVVIFMIVMTFVYYREDADDAFYVSNVALFAESARLNPYDSSFGNPSLGTVPMYDFQVYEPVMSLLCRLFRVSAAILMHSFCVPLFLIVSASAYLYLGRVLGKGSFRDGCLYFLLLSTAHLFGGYSGYSEGIFLLGRIWQGKTLYLTIIL